MDKPRVQYIDVSSVKEGANAVAFVIGRGWIRTTKVQKIWPHPGGMPMFETLNTIYAPPETDETLPTATKGTNVYHI